LVLPLIVLPLKNRYSLCVSIFGRTVSSLEERVVQARALDADLIEFRLDFLKKINESELEKIKNFLNGNEILTIRSKKEGGKCEGLSENKRLELIRFLIANLQPFLLDVEIETIRKHPDLLKETEKSKTKIIASFHDLKGTRDQSFLRDMVLSAPLKSKSLFAVKIVKYARSIKDNLEILDLYSSMKKQIDSSRLVAFCAGPHGISSRILCLFLGSPYSYTSLPGEPVASGQLEIKTMRRIVGRIESA
jgi:3-dehydroquinate dehydratase-1